MATAIENSRVNHLAEEFRAYWQCATADSNLTLHGFRRFKTTHLLNLRFLEGEIADLDHRVYQAGLSLNVSHSTRDRLGLKHSKRDEDIPKVHETINADLVLRLRDLLQKYGLSSNFPTLGWRR